MRILTIKELTELLFYCDYSKPIINILEERIEDKEKKLFLKTLKNVWSADNKNIVEYSGKIDDLFTSPLLKEMIRFFIIKKLLDFKYFDIAENEVIVLRKNMSHLPKYSRDIIIPALKFFNIKNYNKSLIRMYGKNYTGKNFVEILELYILGREYLIKKDYNNALKVLIKVLMSLLNCVIRI